MRRFGIVAPVGLAVLGFLLWNRADLGRSQNPTVPDQATALQSVGGIKGDRFEFEVVESFDAKYEGDTPGHIGRYGGLGEVHPQVALGDSVYHDDEKVGVVTGLRWSRVHGALEVEFDPSSKARIAVGDVVWLKLGDSGKQEPAKK